MTNARRWLEATTVIAVAGTVVIAARLFFARASEPLQELINAATSASARSNDARLSALPFQPRRVTRSDRQEPASDLRVRAAAAALLANPASLNRPRDAAIAQMIAGDVTLAHALMERAIAQDPESAETWSDHAAVYYELGKRENNALHYAQAVTAADRALELDPTLPSAIFNRGIALEGLHADRFARDAYAHYLSVDSSSGWADEVRLRLEPLQRPTARQRWDAALSTVIKQPIVGKADVAQLYDQFPQQVRTWGEGTLLGDWADAALTGDAKAAARSLETARLVARILEQRSGDDLLSSVLATIDRVSVGQNARFQLARAHAHYKKARMVYASRNVVDARALFKTCVEEFASLDSPMELLARYYLANASFDANDDAASVNDLAHLSRELPQTYVALRAQILWQTGTVDANARRLTEAAEAYEEAARIFASLGETANASLMKHFLAHTLTLLGRENDAWQTRLSAFSIASDSDDLAQAAASEAAMDALIAQRFDVAHSFFNLTLSVSEGSPRRRVDALVWRALASWRQGKRATADAEIAHAERSILKVVDPALRQSARADFAFAKAVLSSDEQPQRAVELLTEAIDFNRSHDRLHTVPSMLVERARVLRRRGDPMAALDDLAEATEMLEQTARTIRRDDLRESFFATSASVYDNTFDTWLEVSREHEAFASAERHRARVLYERVAVAASAAGLRSLSDIVAATPANTTIVHYTITEERLTVFVIKRAGYQIHRSAAGTALVTDAASLHSAITTGDDSTTTHLAESIYQILLAPIEAALAGTALLVVVPDSDAPDIPFSVLRQPGSNLFLVERMPVIVTPSANIYITQVARHQESLVRQVAVIGDPAFDPVAYPSLKRLPEAYAESRAIAAIYPRTHALLGRDATVRRTIESMTDSSMVHIAAHSVENRRDPSMSAIVLAAGADDGVLRLRDIAAMDLRAVQLAVLVGCRTGRRAAAALDSSSLSSAFLAAGTRSVIASLWDVDDASTRTFSESLHHRIAAGMLPAAALRATQIAMIHSSDETTRKPSAWAGFQSCGFALP